MRPENQDMEVNKPLPLARPVQRPGSPRTGLIVRLVLLVVGVGLAGVFVVAGFVNPYHPDGTPKRMATHMQLGMPACNFVLLAGKPCPSCGMTTSFALLVRGDVAASLAANWAGTVIALLWALTMVWALISAARGRPLGIPKGRGEVILTLVVGIVLMLMLLRWGIVLLQG